LALGANEEGCVIMQISEESAFFHENREAISCLRKLDEKGVYIWDVMELMLEILTLINFGDFVRLVKCIGRQAVMRVDNGRSYISE
jgi:hypothetical protein